MVVFFFFFFSSRRRHTRCSRDWSSDVCSSDLPSIRADFYLKQGIGQARFGRYRRAEVLMNEALEIAGAAGLHEFEFRVERILAGLPACRQAGGMGGELATAPVVETAKLRGGSGFPPQLGR